MFRPVGEKARRGRGAGRVMRRRTDEILQPHCRLWQVLSCWSPRYSQIFPQAFKLWACVLVVWCLTTLFIYEWLRYDWWKSIVICSDQSMISGNVGKELNQLISMMNNEDGEEGSSWRITFMFDIMFHYHTLFFYLVVIFDWVNFWCSPSTRKLFEIQLSFDKSH